MPLVRSFTRSRNITEYAWTKAELGAYLPGLELQEGVEMEIWTDDKQQLHMRVTSAEYTGEEP